MRLFLVRHGQTAWNATFRAQGHADIPLDATGEEQAEKLATAVKKYPITKVISSDLRRASETARKVAHALNAPLHLKSEIRERSFGDYEGMAFNDISVTLAHQQHIENVSMYDVRPPEGESVRDAFHRVEPFAKSLFEEKENTLVVSHGATCGLILVHLIHGCVETSRAFRFGNTGVTELIRRPEGTFQILRYNDVTHLATHRPLTGSIDGASR